MLPIPTPTLAEAARRRARPMVLALLALLLAAPAQAAVELSLAFTESPPVHYPGGNGTYVFSISNTGSTDEVAALVTTDPLPAGVSISGWDCAAPVGDSDCVSGGGDDQSAAGSGALNQSVDVGAGETLTFTLTVEWASTFVDSSLDVIARVDPSDAAQATEFDTATSDLTLFLVSFGGAAQYTPGDDNAVAYSLTVTNLDDAATVVGSTGATVATSFPAGVTVGTWSCTASAGGSCGAAAAGSGELNVADAVWAAEGTVTWTWAAGEIDYASSLQDDPLVSTATLVPDDAGAPTMGASAGQARVYATSVSVDKQASTTTFLPGGPTVDDAYTVTIGNAGPSDVRDVAFSDAEPTGASFAAWQCLASGGASCPTPGSGSGDISQLLDIPAGGELTYTVDVNYAFGTADVTNEASIVVPGEYNDGSGANTAEVTQTPRVANLALVFNPSNPLSGLSGATYVPGATDNAVTLIVTNNGPSPSNGANLSVTVPAQATSVAWACDPLAACSPSSGTGNVVTAVTIASGASVDVDFTAAFASGELADEVAYAASVATVDEYDDVPGNNSRTNYHAIDRQAAISVQKTDDQDLVNPNAAFQYLITVTNLGPSDVGHAPGESGIVLTDDLDASLRGDPDEFKCGPSSAPCWRYCPGDSTAAANEGDGAYDGGADGSDPEGDDGDCPAGVEMQSGTGDILARPFRLRAGSSSTLRVYAVSPGTSGTLSNTASIALDGEVTLRADTSTLSATDTTEVEATTDIVVTKSDGLDVDDPEDFVVPGQAHAYTIVVENTGFSTVDNVLVSDALPIAAAAGDPGFVAGSVSWQCRAFDGACCNHNSAVCGASNPTAPVIADVLSAAVDLPGQSRVEFTVTGTVDPRAPETVDPLNDDPPAPLLANTASVEVPPEVADSDPANDTSTDQTRIEPQSTLTIDKTLVSLVSVNGDDDPPFRLVYRIDIGNAGPSFAAAAQVTDTLADEFDDTTATWSCEVLVDPGETACLTASGSGDIDAGVDLDVGGQVRFTLTVDTDADITTPVVNAASVSAYGVVVSDTITSSLIGSADLGISKDDGLNAAAPGTEVEYVITVTNDGPDDVFGATVTDLFPPELEGVSWTCEATTPIPGDLAFGALAGASASSGRDLVLSADGRHAYVIGGANGDGGAFAADSLYVYQRNNVPGLGFGNVTVLETEIDGFNDSTDPGPVVDGLHEALEVGITTDQRFVIVLSGGSAATTPAETPALVVFERVTDPANPSYGRLNFTARIDEGLPALPRRLLVGEDFLYVSGDQAVAVYGFDLVSGLPELVVSHTDGVPATPAAMALATDGSALFVGSRSGTRLVRFPVLPQQGAEPAGRLGLAEALDESEFAGIADLLVAGDQLYLVADGTPGLSRVDIAGGPLARLNTDTKASLGVPGAVDAFQGDPRLALASDGEHLLVSSRVGNALLNLRRDPFGGGLSYDDLLVRAQPNPLDNPGLDGAAALAVTADGRHVLLAPSAGGVDGRPLAVYSRRAPQPIFAFLERDRQGDPVSGGDAIQGLLSPAGVAPSPDGDHVYVASIGDDSLSVFRRVANAGATEDTAGAHLEYVTRYTEGGFTGGQQIQGLLDARTVLVSPDGANVYVSSLDGNTVAVFDRDGTDDGIGPGFGQLSFRQVVRDGVGGVDGLLGARGMAMDDGGRFLYVAGSFDSSIAVFSRAADGSLSFVSRVQNGVGGVAGLRIVQDLAITRDGQQLVAVSAEGGAVTVFDINAVSGALGFRQSLQFGSAEGEVALAVPRGTDADDREHVYVVAQNSERVLVYRRVLDPTNPAFRTIQPIFQYGPADFPGLDGPRDIAVSGNGQRVYVASEYNDSVLAFDRDLNRGGAGYGSLALVETRTNNADGVAGIGRVYAIAASGDSRHVYAAGFEDQALATFAIGTGSRCSAAGTGDIQDTVDIGVGGTLVYRARATVRPDASGTLGNTATVEGPDSFSEPNVPDPKPNTATDTTLLVPSGDLSVSKDNERVSVVAGEPVTWEVVVSNAGPSHLVHDEANPVTVSDLLDGNPGLVPGSATWTCTASGSGALEFEDAAIDTGEAGSSFDLLSGASGLALVADADADGPLGAYLAVASALDNSLQLLARDPVTGALAPAAAVAQGAPASIGSLAGANAVAASSDGRFVYVASRVSDALTAFEVVDAGGGVPGLVQVDVEVGVPGLDQALDVRIDAAGEYLYVAGANDDAIAVFARDASDGTLAWLESEQDGIDDAGDPGGVVQGLDGVEQLAISPDGAHLYAVSGSAAAVVHFDRDAGTGALAFRQRFAAADLGVDLDGASSLAFSPDGEHLYLTVSGTDSVVVLGRDTDDQSPGSFGDLALASSLSHGDDAGTLGLLAPRRAAMSADGNHLYVTGQGGDSVAWFAREPASGALTYLGQRTNQSSGVEGLGGATGLVIDEGIGRVYVAGTLDAAVARFARQVDSFCPPSGSGELDAIPVRIAAGGSVTFLITATVASDLDQPLVNTATATAGADNAFDPNPGNNSAVDTDAPSAVADLSITKDDGLAEYDGLAGATALAGDDGQVFVAAPQDNAIGFFDRDPGTGELAFAGFVASGQAGVSGIGDVADLLLSPDGAHLYAVSPGSSTLASFRRTQAGGLAPHGLLQNGVLGVTGLSGAQALAQSPDGRHVYAAGRFGNAVAAFARDANPASPDYGRLSFLSSQQDGVGGVDGLAGPVALAVSPDGRHVYVLGADEGAVAVFRRNDNTGSGGFGGLSYVTRYVNGQPPGGGAAIAGLDGLASIAVSADGAQVYVLGAEGGTLVHFDRDQGTGELAFVGFRADDTAGVSGLAGASRLRASADGLHLYVAATAQDAILRFDIDGATGAPAFAARIDAGDPAPATGGQVIGLDGASDVLVSAGGGQLYAVGRDADALSTFSRGADGPADPNSGNLDFLDVLVDGLGGIAPGEPVTYTIVVSNAGPADVASARVVDLFPDDFASVAWSCIGESGGQCLGSGEGNIDTVVELPAGGSVVFEAVGTVRENANGRLVNTATVSALGVTDPVADNNSATDADTVLSPATNLVVSVDDGTDTATPGGSVAYAVEVLNLGPSYAQGVVLADQLPDALHGVSWTCSPDPLPGLLTQLQLDPPPQDPLAAYGAMVVAGVGQHVYAAGTNDSGTAAIVRFIRDPQDGRLRTPLAYAAGSDGIAAIEGVADLQLSADERWLFAAAAGADAIAVFERDTQTGELAFVASYQDSVGGIDSLGGVSRLALSPDGGRLYAAATSDQAITAFDIDPATGLLTRGPVLRQSTPGANGLNGITAMRFSADGESLLVAAAANQSLAAFAIDAFSGALGPRDVLENFELAGADALLDPVALLEVDGRILVASGASASLAAFVLDADSGQLSLDAVLRDAGDGLAPPRAMVFDPDQSRLYLATDDGVELLSLLGAAPELLASYAAADAEVLAGLLQLEFSPQLRQLYTLSGADRDGATGLGIGVWVRERGSRCTPAGEGGLDGLAVDIAPEGSVSFVVSGEIFANASGTLDYTVSALPAQPEQELDPGDNTATDSDQLVPSVDLSLSKSDGRDSVVAGTAIEYTLTAANAGLSDAIGALLEDPAPVFPADGAGLVAGSGSFSCSANEPLAPAGATDLPVTAVAVTPDGSRLYAVGPGQDALFIVPRAPDGALGTPVRIDNGTSLGGTPVAGLLAPTDVALSADGRQVLVASPQSNSLLVFEVDPDTAALSVGQRFQSGVDGVIGLVGASAIATGRDGRGVYVASPSQGTIAAFGRDPEAGSLAFRGRERDGGGTISPDSDVILGVARLHVSADGRHLYAASTGSESISVFAIDAATGALDYRQVIRHEDVAALAGARDLAASPGDEHLYVLGATAITRFSRGADGLLGGAVALGDLPLLGEPRAIVLDPPGSRLYLADDGGAVHVLARDWSDGSLEHRARVDAPAADLPAPNRLRHAGAPGELLALSGGEGRLARLAERALSRCLAPAGSGESLSEALDLGAGGDAELRFAATVHPSARGTLTNAAGIAPADGMDPQPGNNLDEDSTTITVVSDLSVTKTGPERVVAGEAIAWEIRVGNAGPSDALGIRVQDPLGPLLQGGAWTCSATGGSSCPAAGSGALDLAADLLVGDELVIQVSATVRSSATGTLVNRVELVPEPGASDPSPADQAAEWPTGIDVVASVSVVKDSGGDEVVAGGFVNYTIAIANDGPSDAPDLRVLDLLPPELSSAGWLCSGSGGATCPASGSGNLDREVFVPAGGSIEIQLQALLDPGARGSLSNTASIEPGSGVEDPDLGDNASTDTDAIVERPNLSVQVTDAWDPFDPAGGFALPYSVRVANAGPSNAVAPVLTVDLSGAFQVSRPPNCSVVDADTLRCLVGQLAAGEAIVFEFGLTGLPPAPGQVAVSASVTDPATDETALGDNSDSETTTLVTGGDVAVSIDDGRVAVEPGLALEYLVEVRNIGSLAVDDVLVDAPIGAGLLSPTWTCEPDAGVACTPSGSGDIADSLDLASGEGVRYRLLAEVDPALDPASAPPIEQGVEALVPPGSDINLDNNVDLDVDVMSDGIFRDGFEDPPGGVGR